MGKRFDVLVAVLGRRIDDPALVVSLDEETGAIQEFCWATPD